jgi:hypothetical protein
MPRRGKRAARQAELGEEVETAVAVYTHDPDEADDVAEDLRDAIRDMVAYELAPTTVWKLLWSTAGFPTIMDIAILAEDPLFARLEPGLRRCLLDDQSAQTAVERGDGILPAIQVKRARGKLASLSELAAVFDECVGPATLEAGTRRSYHASWRTVLTWGVAHEAVDKLLPMSKDTLKALTQELLMVGVSAGTIKNMWSSIEDRHRRFGFALPLGGPGDFKRLYKAVAAVKGTPSKLIFSIGLHHLKRLLELVGLTVCQERDVLACILGTVVCLRVVEVAFLQICDFLWDHDAAFHEMYIGTVAVHVYRRKQDTARKGLYARVGLASCAAWDVALRLRRHAERYGLRVSEQCTKAVKPGARCRFCPPFFSTECGGQREMLSRQQVTRGVIKSLELIGVDTAHFSGLSMRRGGISAGLTAKVQEPVMFLQSGHGRGNAARSYMVPVDPSVWYEHFSAFDL